jgi:hypothetical protein
MLATIHAITANDADFLPWVLPMHVLRVIDAVP